MNIPIDISETVLRTQRLILRPWSFDDLEDFYTYASVDGVGQMAGWLPHQTVDESKNILQSFIREKKTFALEYEGKVIGSLGIEKYDEVRFPEFADLKCREIGYVLSKEYWGRELMPEAVKEVIRWLFMEQSADLLLCGHFLANRQSARVIEKCGFHPYAKGVYTTYYGEQHDDEMCVLYRQEWKESVK